MNDDSIASTLAHLIGLPEWLPKAILRTAAVALILTMLIAPSIAHQALLTYADRVATQLIDHVSSLTHEPDQSGPAPDTRNERWN